MTRRTNLLIFITPRIISDQFEGRDTTKKFVNQMKDEIEENDLIPRRSEILDNEDLDRVFESEGETPDVLPTTITPPFDPNTLDDQSRGAWERTQARLKKLKAAPQPEPHKPPDEAKVIIAPKSEDEDEVIDITVTPKLPPLLPLKLPWSQ